MLISVLLKVSLHYTKLWCKKIISE